MKIFRFFHYVRKNSIRKKKIFTQKFSRKAYEIVDICYVSFLRCPALVYTKKSVRGWVKIRFLKNHFCSFFFFCFFDLKLYFAKNFF